MVEQPELVSVTRLMMGDSQTCMILLHSRYAGKLIKKSQTQTPNKTGVIAKIYQFAFAITNMTDIA